MSHTQQIPVRLSLILVVTEKSTDVQPSCLVSNRLGVGETNRLILYFFTVNFSVRKGKKKKYEKSLTYLLKMDKRKCC